MLKQLPVGRLMFYFVRSFGSLPLIFELIKLIIVHHFVSLRRGACIALGRFLFSQLLLSQFPCICIIYWKVHYVVPPSTAPVMLLTGYLSCQVLRIAIPVTSFLSDLLLRFPVALLVNLSGRRKPLPQRSWLNFAALWGK